MTESGGGDAGHGAAEPLTAPAAAQCFPPGGAGVSEVEVFHHHRGAALLLGMVEHCGNRCAHPAITT